MTPHLAHPIRGADKRLYTHRDQEQVRGMVLVDSAHEGQLEVLPRVSTAMRSWVFVTLGGGRLRWAGASIVGRGGDATCVAVPSDVAVEDLLEEQLEAHAPGHAAFDELHPVHVPFDRTVAVSQVNRVGDGCLVASRPRKKRLMSLQVDTGTVYRQAFRASWWRVRSAWRSTGASSARASAWSSMSLRRSTAGSSRWFFRNVPASLGIGQLDG